MILQYSTLVFLLSLTATYAGYCGRGNANCCLEKGIGQRSCNGSGTSDLSDLFGRLYSGKKTYCISGKPNEVYRVWNFYFQWQSGIQGLGNFYGIYAYFFQVPKSILPNNTQYDYYILEMGNCPKVIKVSCDTPGYVAGTDLPYTKLLQIVEFNNKKYFPAPCQVLQGTYDPYTSNDDVALNTRTVLSFSGLTAFRQVTFNERGYYDSGYLQSLIKKYDLYVEYDPCDGMYYQDGYPNGPQYACVDPNVNQAAGYGLRELGFNFDNVNGPGQVCLMAQTVAKFEARFPASQLYFEILSIFTAPFDSITIIYSYLQGDIAIPTYRGLYSAAC